MSQETYNQETIRRLMKNESYNRTILGLFSEEEGIRIFKVGTGYYYIDPEDAIEVGKAIITYYTKNCESIIKEREDYISKRIKEDFLKDVNRIYLDIIGDLREKILTFNKNGGNRGFTCKSCERKFSTKDINHVNMPYIYMYYQNGEDCQDVFGDFEERVDYRSKNEKEVVKNLKYQSAKLSGSYCNEYCAKDAVKALFQMYFPKGFSTYK